MKRTLEGTLTSRTHLWDKLFVASGPAFGLRPGLKLWFFLIFFFFFFGGGGGLWDSRFRVWLRQGLGFWGLGLMRFRGVRAAGFRVQRPVHGGGGVQ